MFHFERDILLTICTEIKHFIQFRTRVESVKVRFHQVASARMKEVIPNILVEKGYRSLTINDFSLHLKLHSSLFSSDQPN